MLALGLCAASALTIAPKPLYRDPVYDGAADPTLLWNGSGHRWVWRRPTWKYAGTANIQYGKPDYTYWAPEVLQSNGVYHMYLSVVPVIFNDWNRLSPASDSCRSIKHLTFLRLETRCNTELDSFAAVIAKGEDRMERQSRMFLCLRA